MNTVILMGRLTKQPELKRTNSDIPNCQFTVAVNRKFKNQQTGQYDADFINCVAWRQTAEIITKYFRKGHRILLEGSMQTRNYDDKNGVKHYITEVVVDTVHFVENKNDNQQQDNNYQQNYDNQQYQKPVNQMPYSSQQQDNPFVDAPDFSISSDDLPF